MDRRADILKAELLKVGEPDIQTSAAVIYNAMDENAKQFCLDILEWMGNNNVRCDVGLTEPIFYYKGEWITKEKLFDNFL